MKKQFTKMPSLKDRWTGKIIGYKDLKTGNLVFPRIKVIIPQSKIHHVSKEKYYSFMAKFGFDKQTPIGVTKSVDDSIIPDEWKTDESKPLGKKPNAHQPQFEPPSGHGYGSSEPSEDTSACFSSCWYMHEGGITIYGCCIDVGQGFCDCWEYSEDIDTD